jgi:2,3-bisphosphoglycerate-dependent phosphoglycerate mutase
VWCHGSVRRAARRQKCGRRVSPVSPTLSLLRHGESTWNAEDRFTGWTDVPLTDKGVSEACEAGRLLAASKTPIDVVHTSLLRRAIATAYLAQEQMGLSWLPVRRHWRLNERHYGALQGLNKAETARQYGADQVLSWRRGWDVPPPPIEPSDERHPSWDRRYAGITSDALPAGESLKDVVDRLRPYWQDHIAADLAEGKDVLVVAHGNSLRGLVAYLQNLPPDEVIKLEIPTGAPMVLELDGSLQLIRSGYISAA